MFFPTIETTKRGDANQASPLKYYVYATLVILDLLTTYIGTPDLKYEGNLIIRYLGLNWVQIILLALLFTTLIIILSINAHKRINTSKRISITSLILLIFYSHYYYSFFVITNNIISTIYIQSITNSFFYPAAELYIEIVTYFTPFFHRYVQFSLVFAAVIRINFLIRKRKLNQYIE